MPDLSDRELCKLYTVDEALAIMRDEDPYIVELEHARARIIYAIENEGYTVMKE